MVPLVLWQDCIVAFGKAIFFMCNTKFPIMTFLVHWMCLAFWEGCPKMLQRGKTKKPKGVEGPWKPFTLFPSQTANPVWVFQGAFYLLHYIQSFYEVGVYTSIRFTLHCLNWFTVVPCGFCHRAGNAATSAGGNTMPKRMRECKLCARLLLRSVMVVVICKSRRCLRWLALLNYRKKLTGILVIHH